MFSEKHFLIVFSGNTAVAIKNCMLKKSRKFMKHSGLFLNMANCCLLVCFFEEFMVLWLGLLCVW